MTPEAATTVTIRGAGLGDAVADAVDDEEHPAHQMSNESAATSRTRDLTTVQPAIRERSLRSLLLIFADIDGEQLR